jgi:hypothetical protein
LIRQLESLGGQMSLDSDPENYEVALEVSALAWETATPLFARYRVPLSGDMDQAWLNCFERASLDSVEFSRFRLDAETRTISFTSRMSDGPAEVAAILKRLGLLIDFVNARAERLPEPAAERVARGGASPG